MMEKIKNIPSLRFSEFNGNWEEKKLGEFTSWASGGTPPKENPLFWDGEIPWISASSMRGISYEDSEHKITDAGLKKGSKLTKKGSLLILVRGSMLFNKIPIGIASKDVAFNQDVKSIVVNESSTSEFILNWFTAFESMILNMVTGTGIGAGKLDLPDLKALEIQIPSLTEQTKIATFLTTVDDKLQSLKQKKTLLDQYKKGVMQKIFSQEIRFKDNDGNDYPDWEKKKLGDVLIKNSKKNKNQEFKLVQSVSNKRGFVNQDEYFEDRIIASKDLSNYYVIQKGDFAYNPSRIDVGSLAYKFDDKPSVISPLYISFKANKDCLNDAFLLEWFSTQQFTRQMNSSFEGSVRNTLSYESLRKIEMSFPSHEEQHKIGNFLSAIDDKINHCQEQIGKTEVWKKGLLQQMFV